MLAPGTILSYEYNLREFLNYLRDNNVEIENVTRAIIRDFLLNLHKRRLNKLTFYRKVSVIKIFFNYCEMKSWIRTNPAKRIERVKFVRKIPSFLTEKEAEEFLPLPILALRDYAILEVLYSTGIRVSELIAINITDINIKNKAIVIKDKWRKKRFVFLGQKAARGLGYYLRARPLLLAEGSEEKACFLNYKGERIIVETVGRIIEKYLALSGLTKKVTPYTFRHSCASHLLGRGAKAWFIQGILGHKRLVSTERYCRIDIRYLKAVHEKYHPRGSMGEINIQARE